MSQASLASPEVAFDLSQARGLEADVVVIGAGGAGIRAAIAAKEAGANRVILVNKGKSGETGCTQNSASDWMAFGAAFGHADPNDAPHEHWLDIMIKGGMVCRPELSKKIAFDAPERLLDLERWGAKFRKTGDKFFQVLSDGARFARACGSGANTGPEIMNALMRRAREVGVEFVDNVMAIDLVLGDSGSVQSCVGLDTNNGEPVTFHTPAVVVATGGAGELFKFNAFPSGMTGDGTAMAYRAGARLANMEFIQIGPVIVPPYKFALSGIFWRLNPRVTNGLGEEFIDKYIPEGVDREQAVYIKGHSFPFSVRNASMHVDVGIYHEIASGRTAPNGGVWMDISHNPKEVIEGHQHSMVSVEHLLSRGIDIRKEKVEFAPTVQHFNGGILINERAESDIPGLYACGEAAGGQHGADRPGGNALADCQVFGYIAGRSAAEYASGIENRAEMISAVGAARPKIAVDQDDIERDLADLRWLMWKNATVVRTTDGLKQAKSKLFDLREKSRRTVTAHPKSVELANLIEIGLAVTTAALAREESRGTHHRADFPERRDNEWIKMSIITSGQDGPELDYENVEVPQEITTGLACGTLKMD